MEGRWERYTSFFVLFQYEKSAISVLFCTPVSSRFFLAIENNFIEVCLLILTKNRS